MKTLKLKFFAFLFILAATTACSLDDGEDAYFLARNEATISVAGPDTAPVNQTIILNVTFEVLDGCGTFVGFSATDGFPKNIVARVDYTERNCEIEATSLTKPYTFSATAPGTYQLRFATEDPEAPVIKTITVL